VTYKVFLVEDEVAAREGIRDHFDWKSAGFELCGEAADGEIALPLIEDTQPDVLITDIKMPFMDGLQLSKIIREHMPWVKIIILSGYNEFTYAQTAVKLGVTEYLLKPVNGPDLEQGLRKVGALLDQEKNEREYLKLLRDQVNDNLPLLREKFLLRLALGGESSLSAIEQSEQLGLDLISKCYLVILIKLQPVDGRLLDYPTSQRVEKLVAGLVGANPDVLLTRKDMEELLLILKGDETEQIVQDGAYLADLIRVEMEKAAGCRLIVAAGTPQQRLGDLHTSYAEASARVNDSTEALDGVELQKLDQAALKQFLETGVSADFDAFFERSIRPLGEAVLRSQMLKHYVLIDLLLSAAQVVSDLGGNVDQILPEIHHGDAYLAGIQTIDQMREVTRRVLTAALAFRESQVFNDRAMLIHQAKTYINRRYSDSGLSLNEVAEQVNFSPNHFSAVFSAETGVTFRDYLTGMRIEQAKKLLRTTRLKCAEVAYQCGYNDPHYFSIIFRKNTGLTPQQFRDASRKEKNRVQS